jgi:DNA repair photolyase
VTGDDGRAERQLRWSPVGRDAPQPALFADAGERVRHPEFADMEFLHVRAKTIINRVPAGSRVPFRHTINVYRGCSHACTYCFARPTHEYLNLNAGRDFERVIVVKVNAVELLRAELRPRRWDRDHIAMGTNTDPYQRCEGRYRLTRGVIETLTAAGNPFSILTKSSLVLRDLDLLGEAQARTDVAVNFSVGTLDTDVWRATEPGTPHPRGRLEAIAQLREAGIPSGVLLAPIIPGISDAPEQLEEVVRECLAAGATSVSPIVLHLRPGVKEQFLPWLRQHRPDLVEHYRRLYPGAYAPKAEQRRIARLVGELVERHGGRSLGPRDARLVRPGADQAEAGGAGAEPGPGAREPEQLGLGLEAGGAPGEPAGRAGGATSGGTVSRRSGRTAR